jgi:hypothetical protein
MTCSKVSYINKRFAKQTIKRMGHARPETRAYRCAECGLYHLTSYTKTEWQERIRGEVA